MGLFKTEKTFVFVAKTRPNSMVTDVSNGAQMLKKGLPELLKVKEKDIELIMPNQWDDSIYLSEVKDSREVEKALSGISQYLSKHYSRVIFDKQAQTQTFKEGSFATGVALIYFRLKI